MYNSDFNKIKRITKNLDLETSLNSICSYLESTINGYDWVGFYFHNEIKKELELKAYSGIRSFGHFSTNELLIINSADLIFISRQLILNY